MDNRDKRSIIMALYIVGFFGLAVLSFKFASKINALYLLGIFLLIQQVYRIPKLIEYYYEMKGSYIGFERYIPVYNETLVMNKMYSTVYLVGTVLIVASMGAIYLLPKISRNLTLDGLAGVVSMTDKLIYLIIFLILVLSFMRGLGYVELLKDIYYTNAEIMDRDETKIGIFGVTAYILVFIPILRVIGILYLDNLLQTIVDFVGYTEGEYGEDEYYEEY